MGSPEARAEAGAQSTAPPILTRLATRLDLGPDELKRALALGLILAGITGSYTLSKTVRDAHFLTELPVSLLPYVYLGVGAASAIASVLFALLTAAAVVQAAVVLLVRKGSPRAAEAEEEPGAVEGAARSTANGYVRALAVAALCSVMVAGVLDYQFKAELQRRFTRSSELVS